MLATLRNLENVQLFEPSTLLAFLFMKEHQVWMIKLYHRFLMDYPPHHYEKLGGFVLMHSHSRLPVYSLCHTSSWMDSFTILLRRQLDERPNLNLLRVITLIAVLHSEEPDEQQNSPQKILDFPKKLKCYKEMIRKYWSFEKEVFRIIFKQLFTLIIQAFKKKVLSNILSIDSQNLTSIWITQGSC